MSTIVLDTLQAKRKEVNSEYENELKNLDRERRNLKKFEARVQEIQETVHELDDAIQRETELHFVAQIPAPLPITNAERNGW